MMAAEEVQLINNLHVHLIPSKKFKTITAELYMNGALDRGTVTRRALLPLVLRKGTADDPDEALLQEKLDDLYGAVLKTGSLKAGAHHIITCSLEFANERFIPGASSIAKEALALLNSVFFNPDLPGEAFPEGRTAEEKAVLRNYLEGLKDNTAAFADARLEEEMAKTDSEKIKGFGYVEDLDRINGATLADCYRQSLLEDRFDLLIIGDFDPVEMSELVHAEMIGRQGFPPLLNNGEAGAEVSRSLEEPKKVMEIWDVKQARLHLGCQTGITYADDAFVSLLLVMMLLGGHSGSKLFSEVREKHSLAYDINANLDMYSGRLYIRGGIAPEDHAQVLRLIEDQLGAIQQGSFTETEWREAKALLINSYRKAADSMSGMLGVVYQQVIGRRARTPETIIQELAATTREQVIDTAKRIAMDTVYLLTNEEAG